VKVIRRGTKGTYLKTFKKDSNIKQTIMKMHRVYSEKVNKKAYCFCFHANKFILFKTDSLSTILCVTHVTSAILFPASFIYKLYKNKYEKHVDQTKSP
jgi:hypothetical protein